MDKRLTREELYQLVWSTPVIKAAKGLGISGVALAKRCRREGVPLPPCGYWARVASGQQVPVSPLPPKPTKPVAPRSARKTATGSTDEPKMIGSRPSGARLTVGAVRTRSASIGVRGNTTTSRGPNWTARRAQHAFCGLDHVTIRPRGLTSAVVWNP